MTLKWNPFAEKFPLLEGDEYEQLKASIKATGGIDDTPVLYRTVNGQMEGLDGRNRFNACRDLKINPKLKNVGPLSDEEAIEFIIRQNITRRHMDADTRSAMAAALRSQGHSIRRIAEELGTSKSTVEADLTRCPEIGTPELKISGRDGKVYSAAAPRPDLRCDACIRKQPAGQSAPNCVACAAKKDKLTKPEKKIKAGTQLFDWPAFYSDYGKMVRHIDTMTKRLQCKDTPAANHIRQKLLDWKHAVKELFEKQSNTKAPKG